MSSGKEENGIFVEESICSSQNYSEAESPSHSEHFTKRSVGKTSTDLGVPQNKSSTIIQCLASCLFYGSISVSITFFNKAIFSVYRFQYPCFVTLVQIIVCLSFLALGACFNIIQLPKLTWRTTAQVLPLSVIWWIYVVTGIAALRYLTIPMFSTLRKSTALIVLILEWILLHKKSKYSIWLSILVMVSGSLFAGVTDLSYSRTGYLLVSICSFATALYLVLIVRVTSTSKLGTFSLLYYNNIIAFPLMLVYFKFCTNEIEQVVYFKYLYDTKFVIFLLFSAVQATLLNVSIFLCTKLNSPLATTVTGQVKDFVTVGVGLFLFGDVQLSAPNLTGLAISLLGSLMYSFSKLLDGRSKNIEETQSK